VYIYKKVNEFGIRLVGVINNVYKGFGWFIRTSSRPSSFNTRITMLRTYLTTSTGYFSRLGFKS
jgi:hypothetical protein